MRTQNQSQIVSAATAAQALKRAELNSNNFGCSIPVGTDNWSYTVEYIGGD
jgi:hypothetical protein